MSIKRFEIGKYYKCLDTPDDLDEGSGFVDEMEYDINIALRCTDVNHDNEGLLDNGFWYLRKWVVECDSSGKIIEDSEKFEVGKYYICLQIPQNPNEGPGFISGMTGYLHNPLKCVKVLSDGAGDLNNGYAYLRKWVVECDPSGKILEDVSDTKPLENIKIEDIFNFNF